MSKTFDVAVVGATGLVGEALVSFLIERKFPVGNFYPLAGERSAGKKVELGGKYHTVKDVAGFDFSQAQIAFFCAPSAVAEKYAPQAADVNCVVIDSSSQFCDDDEIPLVVPEVNPEAIGDFRKRNIIANPGSSTIQMLVALKPLHDAVGIERINVVSFQAVSAHGNAGMKELASQTIALLSMQDVNQDVFPRQIAFNALPQVGAVEANGYTHDELKMVRESQKILGDHSIVINPTTVQAPVFFGHSMALHVETCTKLAAADARELLLKAPGVVVDKGETDSYPTAVTEAVGKDEVFIGRIREDISHPCGLDLWVVADNVRKGAALNSVQLAELLVKDYM